MAYEEDLHSISLNADASLAVYTGVPSIPGAPATNYGFQYRFVKVTGVNQVGLATATTDKVVGVMQNKPQVTGMSATVGYHGVSNVFSGGAVAAGASVDTDATGRGVTSAGAGIGVALTAASAAGEVFTVLLRMN